MDSVPESRPGSYRINPAPAGIRKRPDHVPDRFVHGTMPARQHRTIMTANRIFRATACRRAGARALIAFSLALAAPGARAEDLRLPDLQDESATVLSPLQERKLGEDFMRTARRQLDILDDPELNDYLRGLGRRIVVHSGRPAEEFRFFLVNDSNINAFAVPGGFIGVNTGLILAARSEAELAAVLAHETAHITQRHIPRLLTEAQRTSGPAMAAMLAAILLAGVSGQAAGAAATLTMATLAQQQLNYTRAFEQEADRIGMSILTDAGYDARAMPDFFEQLLNWSRLYETDLPEFLRTHPITTRRLSETRDQAGQYPRRAGPDADGFHHARARIRALSRANPAGTLTTFRDRLATGATDNPDAERYGLAWALIGVRRYDEARREIAQLLKRRPDFGLYRIAEAESELAAGRPKEALAIYAAALRKDPGGLALQQRYAAASLATGQAATARDLLRKMVRQQPGEPALFRMLATAAGETGARLEAHQALAEHYYLTGNPQGALEQLEIARRFAGDSVYVRSGLDARIKEIKDEVALYRELNR